MLNRIAFDSAVGSGGVLARLKLVAELARVKVGLKSADNALARLKLTARANQIRVELGAVKTATGGALPPKVIPPRRMLPAAMMPRRRRATRRPSITSSIRTESPPSARRTTPRRWLCFVVSTLARWMRRA